MKLSDSEMTARIRCALRTQYDDLKRYVLLEEVGNTTGFRNVGWADAVLLHLWPSDGLALWGFEIKASRTDWKKELANPKKSENIARFCDRWIVVAPKGLVRDGELPAAWGLWTYDPETDRLHAAVAGEKRKPHKYLHRGFFASLIRRTAPTLPSAAYVAQIANESLWRARIERQAQIDSANRTIESERKKYQRLLDACTKHGLHYSEWSGELRKVSPRLPL